MIIKEAAASSDVTQTDRGGWTRWAPAAAPVALCWTAMYGGLAVWWAGGRRDGFRYGEDPSDVGVALGVLSFVGILVAAAMTRSQPVPRLLQAALIGFGALASVALIVVAPTTVLLDVLNAVSFEVAHDVDHAAFAVRLFSLLGGMLWAAAALSYARRSRCACMRCGRTREQIGLRPRWWTWVGHAAALAPVPYGVQRLCWALDVPVGIPRESLDYIRSHDAGVTGLFVLFGLSELGGVLVHGLVHRWGERYPRWVPRLGGRVVRPRTAIVPAGAAAVLLTAITAYAVLTATGSNDLPGSESTTAAQDTIMTLFSVPLLLWGPLLACATFGYHLRRRGRCEACGRC